MVAFSAGRGEEIALITYHSIPLAVVGARRAAGRIPRTQVQAGCGQRIPRVLMSMKWWLWKGALQRVSQKNVVVEEEGGPCLARLTA
jgi:hypothetical protein